MGTRIQWYLIKVGFQINQVTWFEFKMDGPKIDRNRAVIRSGKVLDGWGISWTIFLANLPAITGHNKKRHFTESWRSSAEVDKDFLKDHPLFDFQIVHYHTPSFWVFLTVHFLSNVPSSINRFDRSNSWTVHFWLDPIQSLNFDWPSRRALIWKPL